MRSFVILKHVAVASATRAWSAHRRFHKGNFIGYEHFRLPRLPQSPRFLKGDLGGFSIG